MKTIQPISQRITPPSRQEIIDARKMAGFNQAQAGVIVSAAHTFALRTWQGYEAKPGTRSHRTIPLALWELFLLMTNQHPTLEVSVINDYSEVKRQVSNGNKSHPSEE